MEPHTVVEVTGEDGGPLRVDVASLQPAILTALAACPNANLALAEALVEVDDHARPA